MGQFRYLKTVKASTKAVNDILVKEKPVIGVKCLGVNLGEHGGMISLVCISTWDGNVYVFDVKVCPSIMYGGELLRPLQSSDMVKVFHNGGPDSATLFNQFNVNLKNYYDTQIAYSIIMENSELSARRVSYQQLCDVYKQPLHTPSEELQQLLVKDNNVWARRPCTKDMLSLAASYVSPLVPKLFTETDSRVPQENSAWFIHLCEENRLSMRKTNTSGRKSKTKCPKNRLPTNSLHIVPLTQDMHFCL